MSRSLAIELAPDNIRVNAVCPGPGDTPMLSTFVGGDAPELRAAFLSSIPLGRLCAPLDVANAMVYLAYLQTKSVWCELGEEIQDPFVMKV